MQSTLSKGPNTSHTDHLSRNDDNSSKLEQSRDPSNTDPDSSFSDNQNQSDTSDFSDCSSIRDSDCDSMDNFDDDECSLTNLTSSISNSIQYDFTSPWSSQNSEISPNSDEDKESSSDDEDIDCSASSDYSMNTPLTNQSTTLQVLGTARDNLSCSTSFMHNGSSTVLTDQGNIS